MPWITRALRAMTHFNIGAALACAAWFLMHGGGWA
jgi:hypothetical protein